MKLNKRSKKTKIKTSSVVGYIVLLCVIGTVMLIPLFDSGNFYASLQGCLSPYEEIFQKTEEDINNPEGIDTDAKELANLAENEDKLLLYAIDTGNSDCILLRTPEGKTVLIDSGESDDFENIRDTLKALDIKQLDCIIATHPDADHIGSMGLIVKEFKPLKFYMPIKDNETITYQRMVDSLTEENIIPTFIKKPLSFKLGDTKFDILQPTKPYENTNDNSIVLLVTHGDNKMLFIGDAEEEAIYDLIKSNENYIDVDVLKVGHHGSSTSTKRELLKETTPKLAVINCGKDNEYGHPHKETLNLLNEFNVTILRTDQSGDIAIFSDGEEVTYDTQFN